MIGIKYLLRSLHLKKIPPMPVTFFMFIVLVFNNLKSF